VIKLRDNKIKFSNIESLSLLAGIPLSKLVPHFALVPTRRVFPS
jgi:hypothetical protein